MQKKIAVVTGANKGIGFAVAKALAEKSYHVIMIGRDQGRIQNAVQQLKSKKLDVVEFVADVGVSTQVKQLGTTLREQYTHIDVLINNAGVILETDGFGVPRSFDETDPDLILETININTVGAMRMIQQLLPLLKKSSQGRIVNISSGMGALTDMYGGWPGYRMSKTAMNALTKVVAAETRNTYIKVNSISPGWVRTDMGGPNGERSVDQAVPGILWAAELPANGPTGGFFLDGKRVDW